MIARGANFPIHLALNGTCEPQNGSTVLCTTDAECKGSQVCVLPELELQLSAADSSGVMTVVASPSNVLPPVLVPGVGMYCLDFLGSGFGTIDCDGGLAGRDLMLTRDHNGPEMTSLQGTYSAGDMALSIPLGFRLVSGAAGAGADGEYCTGDDLVTEQTIGVARIGTGSTSLQLTTANNTSGSTVTTAVSGNALTCSDLQSGNTAGLVLSGGTIRLNTLMGDTVFELQWVGR